MIRFNKKFFIYILLLISLCNISSAIIIKDIKVFGNERITLEAIKIFSPISINDDADEESLNDLLKELYKTNYFKNINAKIEKNILSIYVEEHPIIQNINYKTLKSDKLIEEINSVISLKVRSPYIESSIKKEKEKILFILKSKGYYNPSVDLTIEQLNSNLINITLDIELGKKTIIKKISFIGNKIFKDRKLRRVIASEEYKFWKFISGRKYLNEGLVQLDLRLLKNFYLNNGFYNVEVNSTFAKLINENEFELIFNINANEKIFFGDISLELPEDFNRNNFEDIEKFFTKIKNEEYSINTIDNILEKIDSITELEQYEFITASVNEEIVQNKINLIFKIGESEKFYVKKINVYGNNVTKESVIRNQFISDEGDPYNKLLLNKSINNLKSLNFFKNVNYEVIDSNDYNSKIINVTVEEKPTGEILASAGVGTSGSTIGFGIKENNFLGSGIYLDSNIIVSSDSIKGLFSVINPNYNNTNQSVYFRGESSEQDNYKTYGYKTNKIGVSFGTSFEFYDDTFFGVGLSNMYEKIETDETASVLQKSQEGNYWDSFIKLDFDYDKRDQKFQTNSGFRSFYSIDLPVISETKTIKNRYNYSYYTEIFDKNISSFSIFLESANSIDGNVKLSERVNMPSSKLRGFESGRLGPKDGEDFIGGNYAYAFNFNSTIPQLFEESQNLDILYFIDVANVWGVDYDSSLQNFDKIRSSTGIGLDWFTPIGPLNFSVAYPISKQDTDKTEKFRFNLGTTF